MLLLIRNENKMTKGFNKKEFPKLSKQSCNFWSWKNVFSEPKLSWVILSYFFQNQKNSISSTILVIKKQKIESKEIKSHSKF